MEFPYLKMTAVVPSCWSILKRITGVRREQKGFDVVALRPGLPIGYYQALTLCSEGSQINSHAFQELSV